jgi:uncharacterized protein YcbK (DUF882 family)
MTTQAGIPFKHRCRSDEFSCPSAELAASPLAMRSESFSGGKFRKSGVAELNHFLRDGRTNDVSRIDTHLFDTLVQLHGVAGADRRAPFTLISGYRSPKTNGRLHCNTFGVASKSQHMLGKAVDISLRNVRLANLQKAALSLRAGGVGYYPESNFVHIDTGRSRHW